MTCSQPTSARTALAWRTAVGIVLALPLLTACGAPDCGPGTRALVIGIDGADWTVIDNLPPASDGMPNLERLRASGSWGQLETLPDIGLSPAIWTSIATGKLPAKHGISWFMVDQPDGSRAPVRSTNRTCQAIWSILARAGRRAAVTGWWATYPAEDVGDGVIVSDALGFHGFGSSAPGDDPAGKTHPAELVERARGLMPAPHQLSAEFVRRFLDVTPAEYAAESYHPGRTPRPDPRNPIHLFQLYAVTAEGYTAITEQLLTERDDDLAMVYFEQVDSLSHLFMRHAPPRLEWVDEAEYARYQRVVSSWYTYQDQLIGRLLAHVDLERTAVFVVSDHGFKSGDRRIRSENTIDVTRAHLDHERFGILAAAGPHITRGSAIAGASVLDLTPTLLYYLGLPVGRDMDGRVLAELFEPEFRERHPIQYVATHEPTSPEAASTPVPAWSANDQQRALETLGYVQGSGADQPAAADAVPSSPEIHNNLAHSHLAAGDLERARREFSRALELDPANAEALLGLAAVARQRGQVQEAEHRVRQALQGDPSSVSALCELAAIKRDAGDLAESIRLYQEALRIDSQPFAWLGLGDSLQRAGHNQQAVEAFERALELNPDSFEAHYDLGVTLSNLGRDDQAITHYEKALELAPRHPNAAYALNNLASILLAHGRDEEAVRRFTEAMELSPTHLESRYNLAAYHLRRGELELAIPLLEQATRISPDHELANLDLGMAYLDTGRAEEAFRHLLLVRRLYPANWVATLGLAILKTAAGDLEQGRALRDEAIRLGGEEARAAAARDPRLAPLAD